MTRETSPEFRRDSSTDLGLDTGGMVSGQSDVVGLKPDSGPWKEAVDRPDLVENSEAGRIRTRERMAGLGIPPNKTLWEQVLETPGFAESWQRAREQAKAGEEVSLSELEQLQEEI